jgi:hypothetical protein
VVPDGRLDEVSPRLRPVHGRRSPEPVYSITGARRSVIDDVDHRTRRYLWSMGIRTVCFLLAVATDGPLRWVLIVAAIVLPYLSVVFANGGRESVQAMPVPPVIDDRRAIGGSES